MKLLMVVVCALGAGVQALYHRSVGIPAASEIRLRESMRVAGGLPSFLGEHPFLAGLVITLVVGESSATSVCSGALISDRRVLTAAQCVWDGDLQAGEITVVLGSIRLFSGGTRRLAVPTLHPDYNATAAGSRRLQHDIAVLTIAYVRFSNEINVVPLPKGMTDTFVGRRAEVIGFGRTGEDIPIGFNQALRDVYVPVISNSACTEYYWYSLSDSQLCTNGTRGRGPCGGDGGAPLILRYYTGNSDLLIGLVSFSHVRGCQSGNPTGYTRITSYMSWIETFL
ncbi:collagenase-like [Spodoptera frugiperda]|uniref:Collagenase-like n=1 Tax=Spodoptera frugiperda TaxID=7108 RepID=A0A9R0DJT8_SPOFR|nr:collagenase-like [Spodoptera frugiperda]